MALRCVVRPNRKAARRWTPINAISAACHAIANGGSRSEIIAGVQQCASGRQREKEEAVSEVELELAMAAQAIADNSEILIVDAQFLERFLFVTNIAAIAWRLIARVPLVGAAVSLGITALRKVAVGRMEATLARKAANDAIYVRIQRVIQNAERARRTGTRG